MFSINCPGMDDTSLIKWIAKTGRAAVASNDGIVGSTTHQTRLVTSMRIDDGAILQRYAMVAMRESKVDDDNGAYAKGIYGDNIVKLPLPLLEAENTNITGCSI